MVNRRGALVTAYFILVASAIEAAGLLNQFVPLILLGNQPDASVFSTAQLQALASLPGHLSHVDYTLHTVFFGPDILCLVLSGVQVQIRASNHRRPVGYRRPRYLIYSFSDFLAPSLAAHPDALDQLPAPVR